ncbi:MAG: ATP synthase F1 subunit gamma [Spirochaetaceae bacterium]|nr:ATP synthase F1 subunit gamma [Spirochaetaceae bacterium]
MANLRDLRLRMRAIKQTLQVTRAMNLISTAKLRKGRKILEDTEPYFNRIQKSMGNILSGAGSVKSEFFNRVPAKPRSAVIVVSSDRGLAGGFNATVFRQVHSLCEKLANPILVLIGSVGYRYFLHSPYIILENFSFQSRLPELQDAQEISDFIISQFLWGVFDEVYILYTHMYSAIKLVPVLTQILPLSAERMRKGGADRADSIDFEYIPSEEAVFDTLAPLYIKGVIYGAMVESYVSEQSARMAAMNEASGNAEDMLTSLQVQYNRIRQAGITSEVSEIISGSSALH